MVSELRSRALGGENSEPLTVVAVDQPGPSRRGASKNPKYADALNRRLDEQVAEHTGFRNEVRQQLQEMRELLVGQYHPRTRAGQSEGQETQNQLDHDRRRARNGSPTMQSSHRQQGNRHRFPLQEDDEEFPREGRRREQVVESRLSLQAPSQVRHHPTRQDVAQDRKDAAAFHKLNPPKFSGGTSEMADNWIAAMRKAFKHLGCTDDQKVRFATFMLTEDAERWWETQERIFTEQGREITWKRFEKVFFEKFFPITAKEEKSREFFDLKQDGMTVAEYERKFTTLQRFAPKSVMTEEFRLQKFISGLRGGIRAKVLFEGCKTYAKAVKKALTAESELEEIMKEMIKQKGQQNIGEPPAKKHKINPLQGARTGQPKQQQQRQHQFQNAISQCDKCKVYHKGRCPIPPGACLKCGKTGHFAKECTSGAVCYFCGKAGHYYRKCPSVKYEGQQQQSQQRQIYQGKQSGKVAVNQRQQGHRGKEVTPQARVFALNPSQEQAPPGAVTGIIRISGSYARAIFDTGADRSFIASEFVHEHGLHVDN